MNGLSENAIIAALLAAVVCDWFEVTEHPGLLPAWSITETLTDSPPGIPEKVCVLEEEENVWVPFEATTV